MYSISYVHKKIFAQNGAGSIPIVMLIFCVSNELPGIKLQFCIRCFKEIFNALLLKATLSLDFFLMYLCYIIFGNKTCSISTFKNKINNITQPLDQYIMRKCGVQSGKVICCHRYGFLSIYGVLFSMTGSRL